MMGYLGRSMFQVEPMPKGAEPIYGKDLNAKGGSDSCSTACSIGPKKKSGV